MKRGVFHIVFLSLLIFCCSCSVPQFREAQYVVAQADSLWHEGQMYGIDAGDSATLAQAYLTLNDHSSIYSFVHCTSSLCTTFAHACYHYGKLLRAKENPVEAMQAFIAATHSRTRDYHILGRVYSNMGDICHLAGEFPLAYDMYERSGDMYLRNGDTLLYYYDLNNMAYKLAEQRKKEETLAMLFRIAKTCIDNDVLDKLLETKARLYLNCKQYDSTLYYAKQLLMKESCYSSAILLAAQAYSFAGNGDSASLYAKMVLALSNKLYETNNALCILTQDDKTKDIDGVRKASAKRADSQKLIEKHRSKLSQATQLLEQDLVRKPDLRWLYAIIVTVVIMGIGIILYVHRKRNQHHLLSQQIEDLTLQNIHAQQQHEQILQEQIDYAKNIAVEIDNMCATITHAKEFPNNINWKDFAAMCKILDDNFYMFISKLNRISTLNETEIRLCVLVFLNMDRAEISDILPYAKNGVGKLKYRVAQKLGIDSKDMRKYLISVIVNKPSAT